MTRRWIEYFSVFEFIEKMVEIIYESGEKLDGDAEAINL